jgi:FkbM family methyltransferase
MGAPEPTAALATKTLAVDGSAGLNILATPETRRFRQRGVLRLDPAVRLWLDEVVGPGDVLYDVGAGVGTYSLVAAIKRGALAVAFEPGFAVYRTLCENVRLNDAAHGVIPLPIALTDRAGFFELEFSGTSGGEQHALRNREWRPRHEAGDHRQGQPVCAERLDAIVTRYGVAAPNVIRLSVRRDAERVIAGAGSLLKGPALRSILLTVARRANGDQVASTLRDAGFTSVDAGGSDDVGFSIRFDRDPQRRRAVSAWTRIRNAGRRR